MGHYRIYLSGPIWNRTYVEATEWRVQVYAELADYAEILDPMRDRHLPEGMTVNDLILSCLTSEDPSLATDRGIVVRDYYDTITSNLLIVNLVGATRASIGTIAELSWAYHLHIPSIVIIEPDSVHDHAFIREMTSFRVDSIDAAIIVAKSIIGVSQFI